MKQWSPSQEKGKGVGSHIYSQLSSETRPCIGRSRRLSPLANKGVVHGRQSYACPAKRPRPPVPVVPQLLCVHPSNHTHPPRGPEDVNKNCPHGLAFFCSLEFNPAPVVGDWDCQLAMAICCWCLPLAHFLMFSLCLLGNLPFFLKRYYTVRCRFG